LESKAGVSALAGQFEVGCNPLDPSKGKPAFAHGQLMSNARLLAAWAARSTFRPTNWKTD
jgi:hypothetical protein